MSTVELLEELERNEQELREGCSLGRQLDLLIARLEIYKSIVRNYEGEI